MMKWILSVLLVAFYSHTFARDYFVGGAGASDNNPGTAAQPFATIQRAANVAVSGDVVYIRSGTYRETIVPANSGVTFRNDAGAVATISGLNAVTSPWTAHSGQIYKASVTLPVNGFQHNLTSNTTILANQVFKNGEMQFQARWPKVNSMTDLIDRTKYRHFSQAQIGRTSTTDNGMPAGNFTGASIWITGWFISESRQITSHSGKTINYSALNENGKFQRWYYITNDLELLTQAKEWHYENGTLYFWQEGGGAPTNVEYKARNWGFDLRGKDNTQIIGLHFIGCEPATGDTQTDNTLIDNIRANYTNHAFNTTTGGDYNYFNAKQVGIKLLGNNNTIRNSEFKYVSSQVIWASNGTVVENNLCTVIGWEGNYGAFVTPWGTSGGNIKILRNTVHTIGRSAVDFGHGNHPNIEVGYNHFYNFSTVTTDVGATYGCCGVVITGTRIHHNWIHDNAVGDDWKDKTNGTDNYDGIHVNIYFDQGAGPATVDHNVMWNGGVADAYSEIKNGVLTNWYNNTFGSTAPATRESYFCPHDSPSDVFRNNIFLNNVNVNWRIALNNDNPSQPGDVTNSIFSTTDARFVGPVKTGLGYKLQANSPAINTGVIIPGITENTVGAPDAGAYEYGAPDWIPGYVPVTTNPAPNTPPVVSITAPANNTTVAQGTAITINATASDANGTISRVEFFNGTTKLGEDTSAPYSFVWNNAAPGTHTITARATDNANATVTSAAITITVNANAAPSVGITAPANNAVIAAGTAITITATATDANGTVSKVEFFDGTTKLGEDTSSPYSFTWNNPAAGSHSLTARATDNDGGTATSTAVAITVGAANTPPTVSITSPANNAQFTTGANVTINANAADANGTVSKVEFFNGTTKLGEDLTAPYSFAWNSVPAGTHSLTARATDNSNAVTNSTAVSITVAAAANTPPVVSLTSPTNNAQFAAGATINITAVATDANGTVTRVEFFDGATKLGEDLTSPYSFAWNNATAGSHTITARATDNGNLTRTSSAVIITVGTSNAPPTVSITSPVNNTQFTSGATITITANAADANGTVTKVEFFAGTTKLGEDLSSPYSFVWNGATNGSHVLTARATDNGGLITTSTSVSIAVNPNNAPVVAITSPLNNATFMNGSSITISATATDANGSVSKVEFFDGTTKLGEDLSSPYTFIWTNVSAGPHLLSAKATDNLGVVGTSNTVTITVVDPAGPTVDAGEDVFLTFPENSATLNPAITSDVPVEYNWTQVEGPSPATISDPTNGSIGVTDLTEGVYVFELTVTNTNGLSTSDRITITVTGSPDSGAPVVSQSGIPRFFTPNDDGTGDYWEWQDPQSFENSLLTVFNRSGQKIYEAISYNNTWDGKLDGQPLQPGDYYYIIKLPDLTDLRGAVRIVR